MKQLITTAVLLISTTVFAQVGINNTSPKATLDITAKTSGTKPEGLIIPQLSGSDIRTATTASVYGAAQKGLIIYATAADSAPAGATASITAPGYYYFDGSVWQKMNGAAATDATTTSKGIVQLAGDLSGTATSPTVAKIQSKTVSSTAPTNGQVLKYNTSTSAWEPAADADTNTTYTAGSGMTLTGTSFSANDATTSAKGIVQLAGDLAGTATAPTVAKIQSKAVSSTAPTNGQVLKYNTTTSAWEPAADIDTNTTYTAGSGLTLTGTSFSANDATTSAKGIVQLAGDLAGTATSPTVAKIQSKAVASTAPTNGQVLKYNTTTSAWEPAADTDTNTTYTAGSGMTLTGTSFSANDATTSAKGIVQLAGDLAGTAASPSIAGNAVNSAKIADGTVANADLANMNALTVKGNATNAAATPTDIAAGTDGYVLRRSGTSLGFGTVDTAGITDGAVTALKLNQMSATSGQVLGWNGSVWTPTNVDTTNDAWINDTTNGLVKLGTKADGTARAAGTDFVVKDNGQIGIGTTTPSAALDVNSTQGGFVPPRMTTSQRDVLISPPTGSIIFNTINNQLELNTGTATTPNWEKVVNSIPSSNRVEHSSLNIAPTVNMNLLTNNSPNWSEISSLKKTITVSVGAQIGVTFNCILNEFIAAGGGALAQADILVTVTPNATGLASSLPTSSYPRDSFALLIANGYGQSTAISVAKSLVATTTQYTVQVYVLRGNSPTNHSSYYLGPIYTNILVTN